MTHPPKLQGWLLALWDPMPTQASTDSPQQGQGEQL